MNVGDAGLEIRVRQGAGNRFDVGVASGIQDLDGRRMDAFQQEELDLAFVEGGLAHARRGRLARNPRGRAMKREGDASMVRCSMQPSWLLHQKRVSPVGAHSGTCQKL